MGWVIGSLLIVGLLPYLLLFLRSIFYHPNIRQLRVLLYLWQAQTAGVLAVLAAVFGAWAILYPDGEKRRRRETALWATFPLALAELTDYANECISLYAAQLHVLTEDELLPLAIADEFQGQTVTAKSPNLGIPKLPDGIVDRITELIEAADDAHQRPLVFLAGTLQIQHSRVRSTMREAAANIDGLEERAAVEGLVDAAEVGARCRRLIIYSRANGAEAVAPTTARNVKEFLPLGMIDEMQRVQAEVDRRARDWRPSWPEN